MTTASVQATFAVLTVSSTRTKQTDTSGAWLEKAIVDSGHLCHDRQVVSDSKQAIAQQVQAWIKHPDIRFILTTGGTGLTDDDVTVDALEPLFDKQIEGFKHAFHHLSLQQIGHATLNSRATAGIVEGCFVFVLPGSSGAVKDGWSIISDMANQAFKPCNFIDLFPRVKKTTILDHQQNQPEGDRLTHLQQDNAVMVDVGDKPVTSRVAVATGFIKVSRLGLKLFHDGSHKGSVKSTAQIAGIQAAKMTSSAIPLCHPLPLSHIRIDIDALNHGLQVTTTVKTDSKTGVEMEALHATSVSLLTIYDMLKAVDKTMEIQAISLSEKTGGKTIIKPAS